MVENEVVIRNFMQEIEKEVSKNETKHSLLTFHNINISTDRGWTQLYLTNSPSIIFFAQTFFSEQSKKIIIINIFCLNFLLGWLPFKKVLKKILIRIQRIRYLKF